MYSVFLSFSFVIVILFFYLPRFLVGDLPEGRFVCVPSIFFFFPEVFAFFPRSSSARINDPPSTKRLRKSPKIKNEYGPRCPRPTFVEAPLPDSHREREGKESNPSATIAHLRTPSPHSRSNQALPNNLDLAQPGGNGRLEAL